MKKQEKAEENEEEKDDGVSGEIYRDSKPFEDLDDIFMKDEDNLRLNLESNEIKEEKSMKK